MLEIWMFQTFRFDDILRNLIYKIIKTQIVS